MLMFYTECTTFLCLQGKVFPKLRKRSPQGSVESVSDKEEDEATDYVFRILLPGTPSDFGMSHVISLFCVNFLLKFVHNILFHSFFSLAVCFVDHCPSLSPSLSSPCTCSPVNTLHWLPWIWDHAWAWSCLCHTSIFWLGLSMFPCLKKYIYTTGQMF